MTHEDFEGIDIRRELRSARPQPEEEFVSRLIDRVRREHPRPRATPRPLIAVAATVAALAVAGAFGGISEAALTITDAVNSIVHVSNAAKPTKAKPPTPGNNGSQAGAPSSPSNGSASPHGGGSPPTPPGGANPPSPPSSPASSQYHGPCPPDMPHGPYIMCRWPPLP